MDINKYFEGGFPLTIERLQFMNDSIRRGVELITKMAGSGNLIFEGMELDGGNLTAGTIVIDGEILPFEASTFNTRIAVFETEITVPYNEDVDDDGNLDQKPADTTRVARAAASGGVSSVQYSTFNRVGQLAGAQLPIGSIVPYDGDVNNIPQGWELYTGLQDKFIFGAGISESVGNNGGSNSLPILQTNLPNFNMTGTTGNAGGHSHPYRDGYYIESSPAGNDRQDQFDSYGSESVGTGFKGSAASDVDNTHIWYKNRTTSYESSHSHSISVSSGGGNTPLNNKPAYKALNFIRRVSI